jgi:hypothetical protein
MSDTKPRILFLPGVFLKDCPQPEEESSEEVVVLSSEDELESIATDVTQIETFRPKKVIKNYDTIPTQFISKDKWPTSTNLLCWICDGVVVGPPWAIITGCSKTLVSDDSDTTDISDVSLLNAHSSFSEVLIMDTCGNFCRPGCSAAYIDGVNNPAITNKHESKRLTMIFNEQMTGVHVTHVPLSDMRTCQQKYCGPSGKTEEQYWTDNSQKAEKFLNALEKSSMSSVTVRREKK